MVSGSDSERSVSGAYHNAGGVDRYAASFLGQDYHADLRRHICYQKASELVGENNMWASQGPIYPSSNERCDHEAS
jgi:hypothetical protein